MPDDLSQHEQRVRHRAHELWEEAGKPEGRDEYFWYRAEVEITGAAPKPEDKSHPETPHEGTRQVPRRP